MPKNSISPETGILLEDAKKLIDLENIQVFLKIVEDILLAIDESNKTLEKIQGAQTMLYEQAAINKKIAKTQRNILSAEMSETMDYLCKIRQSVNKIEPSKPSLSNLDVRNQKFKLILKSYKELLDKYISMLLESQQLMSVLFEDQIKSANPNATPFDLERALTSTNDDCPSVFVQVLMQRGIRKNDKELQNAMEIVQNISQDLRQLNVTFGKTLELRSEANIIIERYRRRWPVFLQENNYIYIIDDDLNLLEKALVGKAIDLDDIIQQRERQNKMTPVVLGTMTISIVFGLIIFTALISSS